MIFSLILLAIVAAVVILASNEGAFGAAIITVSVLLSGLMAMNLYEPIAAALESGMPNLRDYWDFVALVGLFAGCVFVTRLLADRLAPTDIDLPSLVYDIGRFGFGAIAGYITMAFFCTAIHTAPIPRDVPMLGFAPENNNLFDVLAPDRQWLGFTQYFSEKVMGSNRVFDGPTFQGIPDADQYFQGAMPPRWPSFIMRYAAKREAYGRGGKPKPAGFAAPGQQGDQQGQTPQGAAPKVPPGGGF